MNPGEPILIAFNIMDGSLVLSMYLSLTWIDTHSMIFVKDKLYIKAFCTSTLLIIFDIDLLSFEFYAPPSNYNILGQAYIQSYDKCDF